MKPESLHFAETHEWVALGEADGRKIATIGVSAFAVEQLTDLVFMALPSVGRSVHAGQSFGEIESVKAVSDLYSPVTGKVIEVNTELPQQLEILSTDPYGAGWMIRVALEDEEALKRLMDYAAYQKQCAAGH